MTCSHPPHLITTGSVNFGSRRGRRTWKTCLRCNGHLGTVEDTTTFTPRRKTRRVMKKRRRVMTKRRT